MKKPNITEGEWEFIKRDGAFASVLSDSRSICRGYIREDGDYSDKEELNNMKAISAVPEMIDALVESIEARKSHLIEWGLYTHEEMIGDEVYRNQYNALKKAGCTDAN